MKGTPKMNSERSPLKASWPSSPQKDLGLTLPENELFSMAPLAYPTDIPTSTSSVNTKIPLDSSLSQSPLVTLGTCTSSPNSIAISRYPSSSLSIEKSFDPFGSTYFSNLIPPFTPTRPTVEQQASFPNKDAYPLLMTNNPTTHNSYGDPFDDIDVEEDATCRDFLYHLIELDLLDSDYAVDLHSDSEPSVAATCSSLTNQLPFPLTSATASPAYPSYLPSPPSSLSSSYSSSTSPTPSLCHAMMTNIWADTYYRYHDPFDDDEFDPTQPLPLTATSPSLSSSMDSLTSSSSYQSPLPSSTSSSSSSPPTPVGAPAPPSTSTMAVDMLMALLPHYTKQQVVSTLSSANYDMDHFLVLISSDGRSSVSYTKKRQICRHFLMGDCIRQDCRFAHDISIKVCRFWLQDKCLKGNQCEFAHSIESIFIQEQDDFIDHTGTATRHSKSSRSKKKNKSTGQAETKSKSDKPWMDAYQDQEHDSSISSPDITLASGKRHRRRQHKKIKRKTSSVSSSSSSSSSSSTTITPNVTPSSTHSGAIHLANETYNNNNNNTKVRHCDYYEDFPLDEDFPALLSQYTIKSTATPITHHPMTISPHVLALNSISTNFAQVVARNKMKK